MGWKKYLKYIDPLASVVVDKPSGSQGWLEHFTPWSTKAMRLAEKSVEKNKPTLLTTPEPPTMEDPEVKKAEEDEKARLRRMRGRSSTILSGGGGLSNEPFVLRKTLLGGS